ncbi:hypothetical protein RCH34_02370 [Bacillus subtilis]|nr:hypothetical protein [Bacillus subtilis]MEC4029634.1 hypothetical protein [Bacillus subtilis]URZ96055.1 hypothetical protein NCL52_13100 [Bacillus subtilis]CAF1789174.1 hypothetical protein NRS6085_01684 [Bacillus subtilis]CAI6291571.1 hypothetical protein NRS6085_14560 [Bacillus subtilis]
MGQLKEPPVWAVSPNSIIVHPQNGQLVELEEIDIFGWTWAEHPIVTVEVSTDGGESWKEAQVEGRKSVEWQKFSFRCHPKSVGEYLLVVRAIDSIGNSQPLTSRRNQVSRAMTFVQNSLNEEIYILISARFNDSECEITKKKQTTYRSLLFCSIQTMRCAYIFISDN